MNYRVVEGWGTLPDGWRFVEATSVAVDGQDNVFVFNHRRPRQPGHLPERQALQPADARRPLPPDRRHLYLRLYLRRHISDGYGNSRVHKCDPRGRHLFSWGEGGTAPGCFNLPHNVATGAEGLVYVADRENHRVQIFDDRGGYLGQWNNLHRPCGLCADRRNGGTFYVAEVAYTFKGQHENPPREIRSLQKFELIA